MGVGGRKSLPSIAAQHCDFRAKDTWLSHHMAQGYRWTGGMLLKRDPGEQKGPTQQ